MINRDIVNRIETRRVVALESLQELVFKVEDRIATRHRGCRRGDRISHRDDALLVTNDAGEFRQRIAIGKEIRSIVPVTR
jgi:hypothetical protein